MDALAQAQARIAELEAKLAKKPSGGLKISAKGALSVYGLQRFPVTLYKSQWKQLIQMVPSIEAFIAENDSALVEKPE